MIFDLSELSKVARLDKENIEHYMVYIKAVLGLYERLCVGRNIIALQAMRESIGISNNMMLIVAESEPNQHLPMNKHLKDAFMRLAKTLLYG